MIKKIHEILSDSFDSDRVDYIIMKVDEWTISIYFHEPELNQHGISKMLNEAQHHGKPLVGTYSYQKHQPHGGQGQYHLHVYSRNNQIFALNMDGTAHDRSHGAEIPAKVAAALKSKFPDWVIPSNNIIESAHIDFVWSLYSMLNG